MNNKTCIDFLTDRGSTGSVSGLSDRVKQEARKFSELLNLLTLFNICLILF